LGSRQNAKAFPYHSASHTRGNLFEVYPRLLYTQSVLDPQGDIAGKPMDERVEAFLADVLALEGEEASAIREAVRVALADCEQVFRALEVNKRMKEKAAHACHALCRARVVEEMRLRKGTTTAEHLKLILSVIDGPRFP
jgi:hypothetical protein